MKKAVGHLKKSIKKSYYVYALLAVIVAGCIAVGGYIKSIHADDGEYNVASEVVINGKTYSADKKMKVLMIAPDEAYDELGILIGDNAGSIKYTDLMNKAPSDVTDGEFRNNIINYQTFTNNSGLLSNTPYRIAYKFPDGTVTENISSITSTDISTKLKGNWKNLRVVITKDGKEIPYRNVFGAMIFDNYDMDDKMQLDVKKPSDISMSDLESADLVYISGQSHNNFGISVYNYINNKYVVSGKRLMNKDGGDLDADEALYLFLSYAKGEKKVILDATARQDGDNGMNLNRIDLLFTAIDPDVFMSDFAAVKGTDKDNFSYRGSKGCIRIENNQINLYYKTTDKKINFGPAMFKNTGNNFAVAGWKDWNTGKLNISEGREQDYIDGYPYYDDKGYPYYNANAIGKHFVNNSLFVFDGGNAMTCAFTTEKLSTSDGENGDYKGTTFAEAYDKNGNNGELHPADAIEYILGVYTNRNIDSIKVLEIEPAGYSRYDNDEGKEAIARWLGLNKSQYDKNKYSKISDIVTIDCYSMNAFNGLNKDIRSEYDVVIVGAYDDDKIDTGFTGGTYYYKDVDNSRDGNTYTASGNDITKKAYDELYAYASIGMPLVIDNSIAYSNDTIVSGACENLNNLNITKLRKKLIEDGVNKTAANVVHTDTRDNNGYKNISKTLKYTEKPEFNIRPYVDGSAIDDYKEGSSTGFVSSDSLEKLHFTGSISDSGNYNVKVYVDRNEDSNFAETDTGDDAELIYNKDVSSSMDCAYPIPKSTRGYIQWRVSVTDKKTGAVKNCDGAFAIKPSSGTRTVKVLQISKSSNGGNLDLKGKDFNDTFSNTEDITGLKLDVTQINVDTFNNNIKKLKESDPDYLANDRNYLNDYSMVVLGFNDNYGQDNGFTEDSIAALDKYIADNYSVMFTHDSMDYSNDNNKDEASHSYSELNMFTRTFRGKIGMKDSEALNYSDSLVYKLVKAVPFKKDGNYITSNTSVAKTNAVKKLNKGQITEYPYSISDDMNVADTHAQYFGLNLEHSSDYKDVVVWYTLAASQSGYKSTGTYEAMGQDAINNYYAYSVGNITYTSAGHSKIGKGDEMKLFVNTFIRALLAGNTLPETEFKNVSDDDPAIEKVTDNLFAQYYRSRPSNSSLSIKFVVTDPDVVTHVGQLSETLLYYDKNMNGKFDDDGSDVVIGYIDRNGTVYASAAQAGGGVYSGTEYTLNLWNSNSGTCSSSVSSTDWNDMKEKMSNGTLNIGVRSKDKGGAISDSILQIAYKPLFNLN